MPESGEGGEQTNQGQNAAEEAKQEFAAMEEANAADDGVSEHKTFAILGYILPILFFLPLINEKSKHNDFARFHANQQLILLIALLGLYMVHSMLFMMFFMGGYMIASLLNLAFLVFMILGIMSAANGKMKELPLIGGFKIL